MDWATYIDQFVVGLIGIVLMYISYLVGEFLRKKIGSEVLAQTAEEWLRKQSTAEAIWHQVEGKIEGGIKAGLIQITTRAEKAEIKVREFTRIALDKIPGITTEEAQHLADEMTSRFKAGAGGWVADVARATQTDPPVVAAG